MSDNILMNLSFSVDYKNRTIVSACYMKSNQILAMTFASDDSISITSLDRQKMFDFVDDLNAITKSCDIVKSIQQGNVKIEYVASENIFKLVVIDENNLYWLKRQDLLVFVDWLNAVTKED